MDTHIESSATLSITKPQALHLAGTANDNSVIPPTSTPHFEQQSKFWVTFFDRKGTGERSWVCLDAAEGISERVKQVFSSGQCHAFAIALHEMTGWPIRGFCREGRGRRIPRHFVVEPVDLLRGTTYKITIDVEGAVCTDAICHSRYVTIAEIQKWIKPGKFLPMHLAAARHFAPVLLRTMGKSMHDFFSTSPLWSKYEHLFSSVPMSESYASSPEPKKLSTFNAMCLIPDCGKAAQPDSPHCERHQPTLPIFHEGIVPMLDTARHQSGSKHAVC